MGAAQIALSESVVFALVSSRSGSGRSYNLLA